MTDLDFFVMLLYWVDSGLAHAFHEGQVLIELGALRELDYQLLDYQFNPVNKGRVVMYTQANPATILGANQGVLISIVDSL